MLAACTGGTPAPAEIDTANDACAHCRMTVSDRRFAAQIVAPGEEPLFFDDIGCLKAHLAAIDSRLAPGAMVFVTDHRTREWVDARRAVFTRQPTVATPMGSGLMAHRDVVSARDDPAARGGTVVAAGEILAGRGAEGERR